MSENRLDIASQVTPQRPRNRVVCGRPRLQGPVLALVAGAVVLLAGCVVEPEREAQDLLPYLLSPTSSSMTIRWRTSAETQGAVQYGTTTALGTEVADPEPAERHSFTLTGLFPDTEYYYQAYADGGSVGDLYSFRTAPDEAAPFSFSLVGDTMYSGPEKLQIQERIREDSPSFLIHVGDYAGELGGYQESLWREHFFEDYADLLPRVPLIPVLGNHEYQGVIMVFFSIQGGAPLFHDYFTTNGDGRWYSYDWGNCHFIVLDANIPEDLLQGGDQIRWLEQDLEKSRDGENDPEWIFACWHEPAFSSGAGQIDLMGNPLRENVVPLMEQYGVDVVFYGHDHFYERSFKEGVTYIVTGGGGAAPHPIFKDSNPYSQKVLDTYQYMRVQVNGRFLEVEAVDPLGMIVDSFSLEKAPVPPEPSGSGNEAVGGCGCSVVERPGLLEVPAGVLTILVLLFLLRMRFRVRSWKKRAQT
jgi:acid phosphatase type 7